LFNLGAVEVGGQVGDEPLGDEQIVPGKEDLGHDVAIVDAVNKNSYLYKNVKKEVVRI
jgi:hypothetical protein